MSSLKNSTRAVRFPEQQTKQTGHPEEAFGKNQDNEKKEHRQAKLEPLHFFRFDSSLSLESIKATHRCFNILFLLGFLTWWCPKSFHRSCSHRVPSRHVSASTTCKNSEGTLTFKNLICSGLLARLCWPCAALSHDTWRVQSQLQRKSLSHLMMLIG